MNYSLLYRNLNSYDIVPEQFIPAKLKQSAGVALAYAFSDSLKVDFPAGTFLGGAAGWSVPAGVVRTVRLSPAVCEPTEFCRRPKSLLYRLVRWTGCSWPVLES